MKQRKIGNTSDRRAKIQTRDSEAEQDKQKQEATDLPSPQLEGQERRQLLEPGEWGHLTEARTTAEKSCCLRQNKREIWWLLPSSCLSVSHIYSEARKMEPAVDRPPVIQSRQGTVGMNLRRSDLHNKLTLKLFLV